MRLILILLLVSMSYITYGQISILERLTNPTPDVTVRVKKAGKDSYKLFVTLKMPKGRTTHPCETCEVGGWGDNTSPTRFEIYVDTNWSAITSWSKHKYNGKSTKYRRGSYESKEMKIRKDKRTGKKDTIYVPYTEKTMEVICKVKGIYTRSMFELEESDMFKSKRLSLSIPPEQDETKRQKRQREKRNKRLQSHLKPPRPVTAILTIYYDDSGIRKMINKALVLPR